MRRKKDQQRKDLDSGERRRKRLGGDRSRNARDTCGLGCRSEWNDLYDRVKGKREERHLQETRAKPQAAITDESAAHRSTSNAADA